ncbi:hypothetical protein Tco_0486745 [Tanacetum coccineum]
MVGGEKSRTMNLSFWTLYAQVAEDNLVKHEEAVTSYADLKWEIKDFHDTTFRVSSNTNANLIKQILNKDKAQHVEGINKILTNLKEVNDVVKEDPALNKKVLKAAKAYTNNSLSLTDMCLITYHFSVTDIPKMDKNETKTDKTEHGIRRV